MSRSSSLALVGLVFASGQGFTLEAMERGAFGGLGKAVQKVRNADKEIVVLYGTAAGVAGLAGWCVYREQVHKRDLAAVREEVAREAQAAAKEAITTEMAQQHQELEQLSAKLTQTASSAAQGDAGAGATPRPTVSLLLEELLNTKISREELRKALDNLVTKDTMQGAIEGINVRIERMQGQWTTALLDKALRTDLDALGTALRAEFTAQQADHEVLVADDQQHEATSSAGLQEGEARSDGSDQQGGNAMALSAVMVEASANGGTHSPAHDGAAPAAAAGDASATAALLNSALIAAASAAPAAPAASVAAALVTATVATGSETAAGADNASGAPKCLHGVQ